MQVRIKKKELIDMINVTSKAVSPKVNIEALTGLKLSAEREGNIKMRGENLDMGIQYSSSADVTEGGEIIVNPKMFGETVKRLSGEVIDIKTKDNSITLTSGQTKITLKTLKNAEYPDIQDIQRKYNFTISQNVLRSIIQKTSPFAAESEGKRPVMTGILLNIKNRKLTAVASNGQRLAHIDTDTEVQCDDMNFIIPVAVTRELLKITDDTDRPIEVVSDGRKIVFDYGRYVVSSRLIYGEYFNYEDIMKKQGEIKVTVSKEDMNNLFERTLVIVNSDGLHDGKKTSKIPVRLKIADNLIKADCVSTRGRISDEITAETTGDITIGFNCEYMLEALRLCEEDKVDITLSSPTSGCFIHDIEGVTYLVLPVRLSN